MHKHCKMFLVISDTDSSIAVQSFKCRVHVELGELPAVGASLKVETRSSSVALYHITVGMSCFGFEFRFRTGDMAC
jgi:hypothetical protein